MPEIRLKHIVSCNSQDKKFPADNLLDPDSRKRWKCVPGGEKQAIVVIQLEKSSQINSLDIGNEFSAFVELLVGRSTDQEQKYQVLLPASAFMNPKESRDESMGGRVRMFEANDLPPNVIAEKWDRLKIVCSQPFNKTLSYGLSFIRLNEAGPKEDPPVSSTQSVGGVKLRDGPDEKHMNLGSMFLKRKNTPENKPPEVKAPAPVAVAKADPPKPKAAPKEQKRSSPPPPPAAKRPKTDERKKSPERPKASSSAAAPRKPARTVPFEKLLSNVTFVLSGFENPYRGQLRQKATEMGAKYRADWNNACTHLICAFTNTPKYRQVKGKGAIVGKEWITECYKDKKRYSWRKYALDKQDREGSVSDEELTGENNDQQASSSKKEKSPEPADDPDFDPYNVPTDKDESDSDSADTDEEVERIKAGKPKKQKQKPAASDSESPPKTSPKKLELGPDGLPILPDFFSKMSFLLYGQFGESERKQLVRFISAFGGSLQQYMNGHVTHVITNSQWDSNFDEAAVKNDKLLFVKGQWVLDCGRKTQLVDVTPFVMFKG